MASPTDPISTACARALALAPPPDEIELVVLTGAWAPALVRHLAEQGLPLQRLLFLLRTIDVTSDLEQLVDQRNGTDATTMVCVPINGALPSPAELNRDLREALLHSGASSQRLLVVHDEALRPTDPIWYDTIAQGLDDLCWGFNDALLALLPELDESWLAWADHLMERGQFYSAVKVYHRLPATFACERMAASAIRCWRTLGAAAMAREWLDALPQSARLPATREIDRQAQEGAAAMEVRWRQNHAALQRRAPKLAERLCAVEPDRAIAVTLPATPFWIDPAQNPSLIRNDYALLVRPDGRHLRELNSPRSPAPLARLLSQFGDVMHAIVIGSLKPYSALWSCYHRPPTLSPPHLFRAMQQAVYVVEPDLIYFANLLRAVDFSPLFEEERIAWFVGEAAEAELEDYLRSHLRRLVPLFTLPSSPSLRATLSRAKEARTQRRDELLRHLAELWDDDYPAELVRAFGGERPLRLWMQVTDFDRAWPWLCRTLQQAFESLGVIVYLLHEQSGCERIAPEALLEELVAFRPDIIFLNDDLRTLQPFSISPHVPVVCWLQDDIPRLRRPEAVAALGKNDFAYGTSPEFAEVGISMGFPRCGVLPMALDPDLFHPMESMVPLDQVVFLTQLVPVPDPDGMMGFCAHVAEWVRKEGVSYQNFTVLSRWVRTAIVATGHTVTDEQWPSLLMTAIEAERQEHYLETVRWAIASGVPLALYGRGWGDWPEFARFARGEVAVGEAACRAYQQGKLVVHVNTNNNVHQRLFEAIGAGTLVAVRSLPSDRLPGGLADHLEIGKEVAVFSTQKELHALIDRALHDEPWRQGMVAAARRRVLSEHTFRHRAKWLLNDLRSQIIR